MARGLWEDFTDKYGFGDGGMLEGRDFRARNLLVGLLNKQPEMKTAGIRAIEFDRPGVHNSCLILFAKDDPEKTDEQLLENFDFENQPEMPEIDADLNELIEEAYDAVEED